MKTRLRNPDSPDQVITWQQIDDERLFQLARLVVSAEIAKIHTIEWTTQLLYDEPLHAGMNSNWFGLFNQNENNVSKLLRRMVNRDENLFSRWAGKITRVLGGSPTRLPATHSIPYSPRVPEYSVLAIQSRTDCYGGRVTTGAL